MFELLSHLNVLKNLNSFSNQLLLRITFELLFVACVVSKLLYFIFEIFLLVCLIDLYLVFMYSD